MAGNRTGWIKGAAKKLNITPEEYVSHVNSGEKWCYLCAQWKPLEQFAQDRTRTDGRKAKCRNCDYTRKTEGPNKAERQQKRTQGLIYCRKCGDWRPASHSARRSLCRIHTNEATRNRYANDERYRRERKQHAHSRKRNVDPIPPEAQELILQEFGGKCAYCGDIATTWDHVVPIAKGGETTPYNVVPACVSCNSSKGCKDVYEWAGSIISSPYQAFYDRIDLEWL